MSRAKEAPQEDWVLLYYTSHTACIFSSGTLVPVLCPSVVPIHVTVHLSCANIVGSSIFNIFYFFKYNLQFAAKPSRKSMSGGKLADGRKMPWW